MINVNRFEGQCQRAMAIEIVLDNLLDSDYDVAYVQSEYYDDDGDDKVVHVDE
mgnify:FL=1